MKSGPTVDGLLDLVGLFYASVLEPGKMPQALESLRTCLGASASQIYTYRKSTGAVLDSQTSELIDRARNDQYVAYWGAHDPRPVALSMLPSGSLIVCHQLFDQKYVDKSSFYQDFFIPNGLRWAIGGMFDLDDGTSTVVAGVRAPDLPAFESWSAQALKRLLPHVQRASTLRRKLQVQKADPFDLSSLIEALTSACFAVDSQGRILVMNRAFSQVLPDLRARVNASRLCFADEDLQLRWETVLMRVVNTQFGSSIAIPNLRGEPVAVRIVPWRVMAKSADSFERRIVLVTVDPVGSNSAACIDFRAPRSLTAAERQVYGLMSKGKSAKSIARVRDVSVMTVRSQIASILEKTGCHSQLELMSRMQVVEEPQH